MLQCERHADFEVEAAAPGGMNSDGEALFVEASIESTDAAAQLVFEGAAWAGGPDATRSIPVGVASVSCE